MLDKHAHYLIGQLAQESQSLKSIKKNYSVDPTSRRACDPKWTSIAKEKEQNIDSLLNILKDHLSKS